MIKLNEASSNSVTKEAEKEKVEGRNEDRKLVVPLSTSEVSESTNDDKKDILRFTMLFNKFSSDLKRSSRNLEEDNRLRKDIKCTVYFNKEVSVPTNPDLSVEKFNLKKVENCEKDKKEYFLKNCFKSNICYHKSLESEFGKPQISEPSMMFSESLTPASSEKTAVRTRDSADNLKKFFSRRVPKVENNSLVQLNVHPALGANLRIHNSLTSLPRNALKGVLRSKIPSLTAIETNSFVQKTNSSLTNYWDHWDDLILAQNETDRRLSLQISKSSNDSNRRPAIKFRKEDGTSASDSKLLYFDLESKKQIKKCDKKSRGDSSKKERDFANRKQVQWKTEVDVIYFSTHMAANGDRTGEVVERVMEPLREEWEQQRKGFYAKMVPYHMENHLKDRFISLLKI